MNATEAEKMFTHEKHQYGQNNREKMPFSEDTVWQLRLWYNEGLWIQEKLLSVGKILIYRFC